jgi:energy-coupling factor transporter ATP-binding protein EcfA2
MAVERVRLRSLEISNYSGAGEQPVVLEFDGEDAAFSGPNGSGKTTVLSALEGLKRSLSPLNPGGPFLQACGGLTDGRYNVGVWEWVDARPRLTDEVFHGRAETFQVAAKIDVPRDILEKELPFPDLPDPVPVRFEIYAPRSEDSSGKRLVGQH